MSSVPGLRSCYEKTGRLVYFGRMLDKIRLHAAGRLPAEYVANLGDTGVFTLFDARFCRFLRVAYADVRERTLAGGSDEEILAWCHERGGARTDEECEIWNMFLSKRGWRDRVTPFLQKRATELGLAGKPLSTWFDLIECDEGRDPAADRPWERI
jgi:gluconokinase